MPTTPKHEDMRITPERSVTSPPADVNIEQNSQVPEDDLQETSAETTYMEMPDTHVKTTRDAPRIIHRTKEASREEAIASTRQFFAAVDRRNMNITLKVLQIY